MQIFSTSSHVDFSLKRTCVMVSDASGFAMFHSQVLFGSGRDKGLLAG